MCALLWAVRWLDYISALFALSVILFSIIQSFLFVFLLLNCLFLSQNTNAKRTKSNSNYRNFTLPITLFMRYVTFERRANQHALMIAHPFLWRCRDTRFLFRLPQWPVTLPRSQSVRLKRISSEGGGRLPQERPRFMALALHGAKVRGHSWGSCSISEAIRSRTRIFRGCYQQPPTHTHVYIYAHKSCDLDSLSHSWCPCC